MDKKDLKIVFMGTPDFAVPTLQAMLSSGYNVVAIVTQPDRPVGRHGSQLQPSAVKRAAIEAGLPVLQPEKMKDAAFVEALRALDANLQVVVAFRMLPEVVWAMPKYGTFNVHASLLPQYRGAAPINWAIINGERQTGVTTFFLDRDIDTGRVILQKTFDIAQTANAGDVHNGLMALGAEACLETLERIVAADGCPKTVEQSEMAIPSDKLHLAPKIFRDTCRIEWQWPRERIRNFVRGLSPYPGAWTTLRQPDGRTVEMKVYDAEPCDISAEDAPGTLLHRGDTLGVMCADGVLSLTCLQVAGKRRMDAASFVRGFKGLESCRVE